MADVDPRTKRFIEELAKLLADDVSEDLKDVAEGKLDPNKMEEIVKVLAEILEKQEKEGSEGGSKKKQRDR